ncbi:uncharacterized protein NECHADRAFT_88521 [Fusarium vanettenii 77-13-4]|uniref:Uncharacterized protein n=1 Tax=Fusarium vanettenii (strain ATCC MYA-4622 / CBS 123669 / FGSC 9596 / NRRL 45880 / 77-13-4) TaxID=660122 RepID=C7ZBM1_FUSV7|nr:uncharacterized protein NECHADRAFT_88521 [Fusarium vanettenii 77-13-4]EEU38618.1 predicted protein [Fusarium vanettenii 77-13-4]
MDAPGRISWSPSSSKNNREFETAIKKIAKLASGNLDQPYLACTYTEGKFRADLSGIGNSDNFAKVAANNEIQGLCQTMIDVCQKGLDHPPGGLPIQDIMDYESDLIECAKTVYMIEGKWALNINRLSPLTFGGASLLNGDEVIIKVESGDEKECLFKLFKMLCENGLEPPTEGLEKKELRADLDQS